ncbi:MAG: peptide chain release factor N(5)-glutamine methyltransferase [Candidatus Hydrogenedentes bacterium]|nr:peptide chain release factor N(5)-glutamine methyltransferase [Candidatus Hydrogenedentota bacterium]
MRECIELAARALESVSDSPQSDVEFLLAHALSITRSALLSRLDQSVDTTPFTPLLKRRLAHEPVAYILGEWEFFSMPLAVRAPMLVPRPETEHLVECVLEHVGKRPCRVLEIGTGTGCVALAVAKHAPNAEVFASDVNPAALRLASENAASLGLSSRVDFRLGDLFDTLPALAGTFDVVCSNPPYVAESEWSELSQTITLHEDPRALLAGPDGLDVIRRLVEEAWTWLNPGGLLAIEMGEGQWMKVKSLLEHRGYREADVVNDLAGIPRIAHAVRPSL